MLKRSLPCKLGYSDWIVRDFWTPDYAQLKYPQSHSSGMFELMCHLTDTGPYPVVQKTLFKLHKTVRGVSCACKAIKF